MADEQNNIGAQVASNANALDDLNNRMKQLEAVVQQIGPAIPDLLAAAADLKSGNFIDIVQRVGAIERALSSASDAPSEIVAAIADLKQVVADIVMFVQKSAGVNVAPQMVDGEGKLVASKAA